MENAKITELLFQRDERGLSALKSKYSRLMMKICRGLLRSAEDAEEVLNDSLLAVWESIPPARPDDLAAYVCKITRRKSVNRLRYNTAGMRNSDILTELDECVPYVRVVFENVNQLGVDFARLKVVGFDVYLSYSKNPLANAKGIFELSVARAEGLEPSTYGFGDRRSTN